MRISRKFKYVKRLVKLGRRRKDEEASKNQVVTNNNTLVIKRIFVNKNYKGKTMHLPMEMNNGMIEGLVDTGASISNGIQYSMKAWDHAFDLRT